MCLHTKCIKSCSLCWFYVIYELYDSFWLDIVCLSEIIVVKFYILRRIFIRILKCIDYELIALVYMPPTRIVPMTYLIKAFCRAYRICTVCIADNGLIYYIPAIEKSVVLFICCLSEVVVEYTWDIPLKSAVHSLFIYIWLTDIIVLMEEPFRSLRMPYENMTSYAYLPVRMCRIPLQNLIYHRISSWEIKAVPCVIYHRYFKILPIKLNCFCFNRFFKLIIKKCIRF